MAQLADITKTAALVLLWNFPWWCGDLDDQLRVTLQQAGFTGRIESTLAARLGRPIDARLAELGRLLFFDTVTGLHDDNTCAGCHSPTSGFGDTQSIAIGVQNNGIVGPDRSGPRNQRRTPSIVNTAFYPKLMWNGRFSAPSGDPFNNSLGFLFPPPEGSTRFPPNDEDPPSASGAGTTAAHRVGRGCWLYGHSRYDRTAF